MTVEIKVPSAGESVTEVEIGEWLKSEGDHVERDESLVVLETDKASMELPAPAGGRLSEILKQANETVEVGEVIGRISADESAGGEEPTDSQEDEDQAGEEVAKEDRGEEGRATGVETGPGADEEGQAETEDEHQEAAGNERSESTARSDDPGRSKEVAEEPEGEDERGEEERTSAPTSLDEEVAPMSLLRQGIAKRLVEAQHEAALLTTFNEIDVTALRELRRRWGDVFEERHGVSLGIMSLFVKATIEALKGVPQLNAEVRGSDIVYHRRFHIGIAVGSERGLVVPVLRDADRMSLAEIERAIDDLARRAGEDALELDELKGGTFTITNGGVFGSLLSTPIVNPPQSGILGMHAIQERPVARDGQVQIRPMMYVALTYDHRLVDGREAVGFLVRIKEIVESPERLLLEA